MPKKKKKSSNSLPNNSNSVLTVGGKIDLGKKSSNTTINKNIDKDKDKNENPEGLSPLEIRRADALHWTYSNSPIGEHMAKGNIKGSSGFAICGFLMHMETIAELLDDPSFKTQGYDLIKRTISVSSSIQQKRALSILETIRDVGRPQSNFLSGLFKGMNKELEEGDKT